jgi:hypothetical protein
LIPIENNEVLLAQFINLRGRAWSDAKITELLKYRNKPLLAGDLNAKNRLE